MDSSESRFDLRTQSGLSALESKPSTADASISRTAKGHNLAALEAAAADLELAIDLDEQWLSVRRSWETAEPDYIRYPPSQSQFLAKRTVPLPAALLAQYQYLESKSFMGLLPQIGRAWISIDHRLFLWDYVEGSDFAVYEELDQVISCVALATPRPGVFIDEIEYLLVIATALQVVLLGIVRSPNSRARSRGSRGSDSVTLVPTGLSVPTDGVVMLKIEVSHHTGRIFMAGRDGSLHELVYEPQSWFGNVPKARRVNRSRGFAGAAAAALVPAFLRRLFHADDPLIDLVVDDSRGLLYTLSQRGIVSAYRLERTCSECDTELVSSKRSWFDAGVLRLLGSLDAASELQRRMVSTQARALSLHAVPLRYSRRVHLLVVSTAGERLLCTTAGEASVRRPSTRWTNDTKAAGASAPSLLGRVGGEHPACLRVIGYRSPIVSNLSASIYLAFWCKGQFLAADDQDQLLAVGAEPPPLEFLPRQDPEGSLFVSRTATAPSAERRSSGIASAAAVSQSRIFESVSSLQISGKAYALAEAPLFGDLGVSAGGHLDEREPAGLLTREDVSRGWLCLTQASLVLLCPVRPLDTLRTLLGASPQDAEVLDFFRRYGAAQACSWCLELALQAEQRPSGAIGLVDKAFRACLAFGGEPQLLASTAALPADSSLSQVEEARQRDAPAAGAANTTMRADRSMSSWQTTADGFSVGSVSLPEAPLRYSGRHDGVVLLLARILQPVWSEPVTTGDKLARLRFSFVVLLSTHAELRAFERVLYRLFGAELEQAARRERPSYGDTQERIGDTSTTRTTTRISLAPGMLPPTTGARSTAPDTLGSAWSASAWHPDLIAGKATLRHSNSALHQARRLELESIASLLGLAERSAQALELVRTLAESTHLPRLVASLEPTDQARLRQLRFEDLVTRPAEAELMTSIIFKVLESYAPEDSDSMESLLETLTARCPVFFGETQVAVYRALRHLRKREIEQTMQWLRPVATHLTLSPPLVTEFKAAGAFAELVALARLAGDQQLVLQTLEAAMNLSSTESSSLGTGADRETLQRRCLVEALATDETTQLDQLFRFLLRMGPAGSALLLQLPQLAKQPDINFGNMSEESFRKNAQLTKALQRLEWFLLHEDIDLAWKLYAQQERFVEAAMILADLAGVPTAPNRHPGTSEVATEDLTPLVQQPRRRRATLRNGDVLSPRRTRLLPIHERIALLIRALHFARAGASLGDGRALALVPELQDALEVAHIQQRALDEVRRVVLSGPERSELEQRLEGISGGADQAAAGLLDPNTLYVEIARPYALWETELDILRWAGHQDPELSRRLWNNIIARELALSAGVVRQRATKATQSTLDTSLQAESLRPTPETLQQRFTALAKVFYPSPIAFPLEWLVASLEMLAFSQAELARAPETVNPTCTTDHDDGDDDNDDDDDDEIVTAWSLEAFSLNWLQPTLVEVIGVPRTDLVHIYREMLQDPEAFYEHHGPLPVVVTHALPPGLGPWWLSLAAQHWWARSLLGMVQRWMALADTTLDHSLQLDASVTGYATLARASTDWQALVALTPALVATLRVLRSRFTSRQSLTATASKAERARPMLQLCSELESVERELERLSRAGAKQQQRYLY